MDYILIMKILDPLEDLQNVVYSQFPLLEGLHELRLDGALGQLNQMEQMTSCFHTRYVSYDIGMVQFRMHLHFLDVEVLDVLGFVIKVFEHLNC